MAVTVERMRIPFSAGIPIAASLAPFLTKPPDAFIEAPGTLERILKGFGRRFRGLWDVTKEHYILMPLVFTAIAVPAALSSPVSTFLTITAVGLTAIKGAQAGSPEEIGETLADAALLLFGWGLGRAGQAMIGKGGQVGRVNNPGAALHLVDEAAAGILMVEKLFQ